MMTLPKQLQQSLNQKINNYEEERKMPLLSNMERRAIEKGQELERYNFVQSVFFYRFGAIDDSLQAIIPELVKLSTSELTPLLLSLSREELLDRFTPSS